MIISQRAKKIYSTVLFICCVCLVFAQKSVPSTTLKRPKLVIGIVVDQMRWDYLYRYYDRYTTGGFKRMLNEGFTCENTFINYIPTYTAVGHASIYTGSVPAIHGIAGNDFIINATGKSMYCTEDSTVQTVGSSSAEGEMSPRNLLTSTITDELKLATNFRSKVIGISLKDRGSILPAGHAADAAYWFDNKTGNWITSTFYMSQLPEWVNKFNAQRLSEKYLKQNWKTLYDINTYVQSFPDSNRYEGNAVGSKSSTFPIMTEKYADKFDVLSTKPFGNTLTMEMAKAAIKNEELGKDAITDFLAVSFSSTDYIGHKYGVNAIETEDTYLRLDQTLSDFFNYLDQNVGKGNYTVFLSADHGAAHNPNLLLDKKIPAGLWPSGEIQKQLNAYLMDSFKVYGLVRSLSNSQVHLNYSAIAINHLNEDAITKTCVNFLRTKPGVSFVADVRNISEAALPERIRSRVINGYNTDRSGNICILLQPGWYAGSPNATGTTHGSWYEYDAHIPLVWMGWGIKKGSSNREVNMTDIAPTIAALIHIQAPNGNIGTTIEEALAK
jgi:predicted AlkP superfamily pyrophosphatase or phosphodiesterase